MKNTRIVECGISVSHGQLNTKQGAKKSSESLSPGPPTNQLIDFSLFYQIIAAMKSVVESMQEIFIKPENIKQEVDSENFVSCNFEEELIEFNINVKEDIVIKTEPEVINHDEVDYVFLKNEYDIKTEYPSEDDLESVIIKQEDLLESDECDTFDVIEATQKRKVFNDDDIVEDAPAIKRPNVDVGTALQDHGYAYTGGEYVEPGMNGGSLSAG